MNCYKHPEAEVAAYCRTCGKALCAECTRLEQGLIYCEEHTPVTAGGAPATPLAPHTVAPAGASPGLAFLLGLIPGVGAIYNGQYGKGLVHAVIFGLLVSVLSSGTGAGLEPLFGILLATWVFYMALEAYHTARKRAAGEPVDEYSSIVNVRGRSGDFPAGAVALIALGVLFLLNTLDILRLSQLLRYWPVVLIVIGVYLLYIRITGANSGARNGRR